MSNLADTGSGFITGVDERTPPPTHADIQPQPGQNGPLVIVNGGQTAPLPQQGRFYAEEEVNAMRTETEQRMAEMAAQLQQLQTEREARETAAAAEQERLAAEARAASESEMDVRTLLDQRDREWQDRFTQMEEQRQRDQAIFERERAWNEVQDYRRNRIEQEDQFILPELRDLIMGNDPAEVDASIDQMKARTAAILQQVQSAVTASRPPLARGVAPTGQPSMGGPMEQQPGGGAETLSLNDIKAMDNKTYGQYRDRLMAFTRQQPQ